MKAKHLTNLFRKGLQNPGAAPQFITAMCRSAWFELYRRSKGIKQQKSLINDLVEEGKYAIIVLDACRFDYFAEEYRKYVQGDLRKVWSAGNYTAEYLRNVWSQSHDMTYVSANPWVSDYRWNSRAIDFSPGEHISTITKVWTFGWNTHKHAVLPETVTDAALWELKNKNPDRLVVHYNQPHYPYIGDTQILPWEENVTEINFDEITKCDSPSEKTAFLQEADEIGPVDAYKYSISPDEIAAYDLTTTSLQAPEKITEADISKETLLKAYRDNLRAVLTEVQRLLAYLDDPVIITADHGEFLGEGGRYMHPSTRRVGAHPLLREVPWLRVKPESLNTKNLAEAQVPEHGSTNASPEGVKERLKQLGYVT